MNQHTRTPWLVRAVQRLEGNRSLDRYVATIRPIAEKLIASPRRRDVLHGSAVGHGIHPLMTDLPLGLWTSAAVLDLVGKGSSRPAAQRLVGLGVLAAVPTAVTGLAEWAVTGQREQRVGVVHAAANSAALTGYTASYLSRRRGRHAMGVMYGLAGGLAATVGGYLGGHLTEVRKASTSHPAFADDDTAEDDPGQPVVDPEQPLGG